MTKFRLSCITISALTLSAVPFALAGTATQSPATQSVTIPNVTTTTTPTTPAVTPTPVSSPSSSPSPASGSLVVQTSTTALGTFITDSSGRSLYLFQNDTNGLSTCTGACAVVWPPFLLSAGQTVAPSGSLQSSFFNTTTRPDGTTQVTYNNQPLYYYQGDTSPGNTNGEGISSFGANWYLMQPNGSPLLPSGSNGSSGSGTSGTSGSGSSGSGTGY
jgi:predicted lipoprotein with Yx(FWY)xxD motif